LRIADPLRISMPLGVAAEVSTEVKIRTCADAAATQNKTAANAFIMK
jgi:hypothetical protein